MPRRRRSARWRNEERETETRKRETMGYCAVLDGHRLVTDSPVLTGLCRKSGAERSQADDV